MTIQFITTRLDGDINRTHPILADRVYLNFQGVDAHRDCGLVSGWVTPNLAALVKAAPQMLAALKAAETEILTTSTSTVALEQVREAIGAAEPK